MHSIVYFALFLATAAPSSVLPQNTKACFAHDNKPYPQIPFYHQYTWHCTKTYGYSHTIGCLIAPLTTIDSSQISEIRFPARCPAQSSFVIRENLIPNTTCKDNYATNFTVLMNDWVVYYGFDCWENLRGHTKLLLTVSCGDNNNEKCSQRLGLDVQNEATRMKCNGLSVINLLLIALFFMFGILVP